MDESRLIAEVRKRPLLWQYENYYNSIEKSILWREVSECVGHDAKTCKDKWLALRRSYRAARSSYIKRINLAKKNGKYHPKYDYSPRQRFYNDLSFLKTYIWNRSESINKTKEINTWQLIAEVKKRPALWDDYHIQYQRRLHTEKMWREVAQKLEMNETLCKNRWRYLKRKYRFSQKAKERFAREKDGIFDQRTNYVIKWKYFDSLTFIRYVKRNKNCSTENENTDPKDYNIQCDDSCNENFGNKNTAEANDSDLQQDHFSCDSLEQNSAHTFYSNHSSQSCKIHNVDIKKEAVESEESNFPTKLNGVCDPDSNFLISFLSHMRSMSQVQNINYRAKMTELMLSFLTAKALRGNDFMDTLDEQKENSIIGAFVDLEDPDCNFLMSFLPHLKSLARLEKLKFRLKMSNLILDISST